MTTFFWQSRIGQWLCNKIGHITTLSNLCQRCRKQVKLYESYPPKHFNCRCVINPMKVAYGYNKQEELVVNNSRKVKPFWEKK